MRATERLVVFSCLGIVAFASYLTPAVAHAQIIRGPFGIYPPYGAYALPTSDVRLQVSPATTEVYVDGYYAGIADDFDGVFQRLRVAPGPHVVELYLDGHKSHRESAYLAQGSHHKIRHTMVPLGPGEKTDARPVPATPPPDQESTRPPGRRGPFPEGPRGRPFPGPADTAQTERAGTLSIRVQPANADVLVDGQRWEGPSGQDALVVQLSEGRHRIEVRKDGFEPFSTEVDIRRGETTPVNVSLTAR